MRGDKIPTQVTPGARSWAALLGLGFWVACAPDSGAGGGARSDPVALPAPRAKSDVSVERALTARRSCREFAARTLDLAQLSQLLWAAYGVTAHQDGYELKTTPSAGALYPLAVLAVAGEGTVGDLAAGVYRYQPPGHHLTPVVAGDRRQAVARACLRQDWLADAPVILVVAAVYRRATGKYGDRGVRYTHMEVGHASQNVCLQAEALGLGAGIVGAFHERELTGALKLTAAEAPLIVLPVGYRR